jgi:UDP-N-acetyl-2-amino-2-deoxyglucuronate dehydrogenase
MNFAVIGNGFIAPRHIDAIKHVGGKVVAVCDIDQGKRVEGVDFFEDYKEAVQKADAVAICTPNHLHVPMALYCVAQGKKVLSEKPLGISLEQVSLLPNDGTVFTVLQLRHHPEVLRLKKSLDSGPHKVRMKIVVHRGDSYWNSWKGDSAQSGGILMNIGIHYFDLLTHLFGHKYTINSSEYRPDRATGIIEFVNTIAEYEVAIIPTTNGQDRLLSIDGETVSLSKQDNLSFEDLHKLVYEEFANGRGILPEESAVSIKLVDDLIKFSSR